MEAVEIAQQIRTYTALMDDMSLVSRTQHPQLTTACNFGSGRDSTLSWPLQELTLTCTYIKNEDKLLKTHREIRLNNIFYITHSSMLISNLYQ